MQTAITISFIFFTILVAIISWQKTRKQTVNSVAGYFMAGRSLNFWLVGGALFLTNMSANQFIGENESVYINTMTVMAWGMSSVVAMLIVSEFFMPFYLKIGAVTTPDFLEVRFDRATKKIVTVIFLAGYLINLVPAVLYGGAVALWRIFPIKEMFGVNHLAPLCLFVISHVAVGCAYPF